MVRVFLMRIRRKKKCFEDGRKNENHAETITGICRSAGMLSLTMFPGKMSRTIT